MSAAAAGHVTTRIPPVPSSLSRRRVSTRQYLSPLDRQETETLRDHMYGQGRRALLTPVRRSMRKASRILKPRPTMGVVEFIEHPTLGRTLDAKSSRTAGRFKVENQEISRGPLDAVTEPGVERIACVTSPQMFKTLLIESVNAYFAVIDPTSQMVIEPTDPLVKLLVQNKINPMIASMQCMRETLIKDGLYYKSGNSWYCIYTNAGSDGNLGQHSIRILCCDEIDKWGNTKSGPALPLAIERVSTYGDEALVVLVCTPTRDKAPIWQAYLEGDQRRYYVACPHGDCGHEQVMEWEVDEGGPEPRRLIRWQNDGTDKPVPDTVRYHCVKCDKPWTEPQRLAALRWGRWRQTKPAKCTNRECALHGQQQNPAETLSWNHEIYRGVGYATCSVEHGGCGQRIVSNRYASFHARRFESMRHKLSEIADKYVTDAQLRPMSWANNMLALPYREGEVVEIEASGLMSRIEAYTPWSLPDRCVVITAGVDTQKGYLALQVVAWGRNGESWLVEYEEIHGDTNLAMPWRILEEKLKRQYRTKGGRTMPIAAACVDMGGKKKTGNTTIIQRFCLNQQGKGRRVLAVKGLPEKGLILEPVFPAVAKLGKQHYNVGTLAAKNRILQSLAVTRPGPNCTHFGMNTTEDFLLQLTAEKRFEREDGSIYYEKKRPRNEGLDTRVYALAALESLYAIGSFDLDRLADKMGVPRAVPDDERLDFSEEAKLATMAAMADMDAGGEGVIKRAHRPNSARRQPRIYTQGVGFERRRTGGRNGR